MTPPVRPTPHVFQTGALSFHRAHRRRTLVAHQPGMGKTYTAIMEMDDVGPERVVVACPEFLRENWRRAMVALSDRTPYVYGLDPNASKGWVQDRGGVLIIGYTKIAQVWDKIASLKPAMFVADEAHVLRNSSSQRGEAARWLAEYVPNLMLLTGTPSLGRPIDLYALLRMLDKPKWDNWLRYVYRYCAAHRTPFGLVTTGASNLDELNTILTDSYMHRATKREYGMEMAVAADVVPLDVAGSMDADTVMARAEYDRLVGAAYDEVFQWTDAEGGTRETTVTDLARFGALRQIASRMKLAPTASWVGDFHRGGNGPLVVFAHHKAFIRELQARLKKELPRLKHARLDGDVTEKTYYRTVDEFQAGNIDTVICSIAAAGVGIGLTAANHIAFPEMAWTAGEMQQCIDRVDRIGQTKPVHPHLLAAAGTVDERQAVVLARKQQSADHMLDGIAGQRSMFHELATELKRAA